MEKVIKKKRSSNEGKETEKREQLKEKEQRPRLKKGEVRLKG